MSLDKVSLKYLLREAQEAHSAFEKACNCTDPDWAQWYADFIAKRMAERERNKACLLALMGDEVLPVDAKGNAYA